MNLSEEQPEVNIKEWSCFPKETDFNPMHAWRRFENKWGSAHISDTKLSKASLTCPLEHKVANCSFAIRKVVILQVGFWRSQRLQFRKGKLVGAKAHTRKKLVREKPNLTMH